MEDLYIVTVVTKTNYYFPYLVESCEKNGKKLTILGYNEKWEGFTWRFKLLINFLKKLKSTDIVCFIDGYDVICTRNLNDLKNEFIKLKNETNCKIIIGHDKIINTGIYYMNYIWYNFYFGKCKNNNLNAGTYIGYVKDLIDILSYIYTEINENNKLDDQQLLTTYCNSNNDIYIDIYNKLFLSITKPFSEIDNYLQVKNNEIIYNNNIPFFIHCPGNTYLENTLKLLNYNVPNNNIQKTMKKRLYDTLYMYIKNNSFIKSFILFFLIIITIKYICSINDK
jgi:hypothetical protein